MNFKTPQISLVFFIGIFLFLIAPQAHAQNQALPNSKEVVSKSSGFTKVIDSKIDKSDTEIVRNLIEFSDHSAFLKNVLSEIIYIMDLDHFRDGLDDFMVFGKTVKVLSKTEVLNANAPFYLTISGYNKKERTCTAVVTIHSIGASQESTKNYSVKLEKQTNTWSSQLKN